MIKTFTHKAFFTAVAAGCLAVSGYAQSDSAAKHNYEGMSLKDLLNIKIISVSKAAESLFEAPLSASVVTREAILKSGSTSIMEALRLVPGLIVREQSNGNYDIHLRGMDNVPPNASFSLVGNSTTLVMVDNHPIYSYLLGGTFWETIPVDLNDVEKIEVVRGPAAALYGPNAVNGVINIITRNVEKKGWYVNVNNRQGNGPTFINNASIGYRFKRLSVIASGNFQRRDRSEHGYYEYARSQYFTHPEYLISMTGDTITDMDQVYPRHGLAMEKYAGNVFATYRLNDKDKISFAAGLQHSLAQRVTIENGCTPLSFTQSDTRYADLRGNINNFTVQLSYNEGTQIAEFSPGNEYDFKSFNGNIEYNIGGKHLSIKPGISYQYAVYDDRKYSDIIRNTGLFNTRGDISTISPSLRGEYKLFNNKLRLVGGIALSKFNYPDTAYLSYQLAATWKLNKRNLLRFVYSKAPRSANIFDTYVRQTVSRAQVGPNTYQSLEIVGNKHLKLLTARMLEIGYRSQLTPDISIDAELFNIRSRNYSQQAFHNMQTYVKDADTVQMWPVITVNLPMQLEQTGVTVTVTVNAGPLKIKPFVTWQETRMKDYAPSILMPNVFPGYPDIYSGIGSRSVLNSTPTWYGGGTVDYKVSRKVNINLSSYYYSHQHYYHIANLLIPGGQHGIDKIFGKFILNANVSYEPVKGLQVFCSGRNLLNENMREFFYTDKVPCMIMGGFSYQLP